MLDGQVLLVTGAGGGLATGVVPALQAAGATLALADRPGPDLAGGDSEHRADLTRFESADLLIREVISTHGRLDGVVHLVGGFTFGPAEAAEEADLDRMVDLNFRTLVAVSRAALPVLRAQGRGLLLGVAAGQAWRGGAGGVALYAASKAAVAAYLRSVDEELAGTDVGVTVVFPMGVIDTAANRLAMPDADRATWIDPAGLGEAMVFAATRGRRARLLELPVYGGRA